MIGDDQIVGIDAIGRFCDTFEQAAPMNALQLELRFAFFMNGLDLDSGGVRQQRADNEARMIAERVHPKQSMRR